MKIIIKNGFGFIIFLLMSCGNQKSLDNHAINEGLEVVHKITPGEDNPRNSEGDFIGLNDGKILFIYAHYTGESKSDFASAYLAGRYSRDEGRNWSEDEVIVEREDNMNVRSVSLLRLKNGEIALFYLRMKTTSDEIPMVRFSRDEAKTWTDPVPVIKDKEGYFVLNNDRVIQLNNGRLIVPVSLHKTPGSEWSDRARLFGYYSDDNGKTWKSSEEVPNPNIILLQEPGVVELKDGRIMMYIRTDEGVQYLSFSDDKGKKWSPVIPSNIPSPRSPASIKRIPSTGDLLLVWNNKGRPVEAETGKRVSRTPFNSAISKDEGKTWKNIRTIENNPNDQYCYPAIHFSTDEVLLGYCVGKWHNTTNITKLDLNWIYDKSETQ